jgi:hypothetical protein
MVRRNRVLLKTDLAADFPPVLGDRIQLQQVLLNLLINGIEAMRAVTDRSRELIIRSQKEETDAICVAVQDAGVGIDPQDMHRIFTAFFTTKPEGLGMGLAISRSIIEAGGCGPVLTRARVRPFSSRCPRTERVRRDSAPAFAARCRSPPPSAIVLEKLIDTLRVLAVEHAGAERGLLILPRGNELRIEAEGTCH